MKNFFGKLFGSKYPDRNGEPSAKMGRVYAGPDSRSFRSSMEGVYAGPPNPQCADDTQKKTTVPDDESMVCVYAGPPAEDECSDDIAGDNSEECEPETDDTAEDRPEVSGPEPNGPAMKPVYAGPERPNPGMPDPMQATVYAGPVIMNRPVRPWDPDMPVTFMAYYGPGGPNGPAIPGMMTFMQSGTSSQETADTAEPDSKEELLRGEHKVCRFCGEVLHPNTKFCPNCGSEMANEPVLEGVDV